MFCHQPPSVKHADGLCETASDSASTSISNPPETWKPLPYTATRQQQPGCLAKCDSWLHFEVGSTHSRTQSIDRKDKRLTKHSRISFYNSYS